MLWSATVPSRTWFFFSLVCFCSCLCIFCAWYGGFEQRRMMCELCSALYCLLVCAVRRQPSECVFTMCSTEDLLIVMCGCFELASSFTVITTRIFATETGHCCWILDVLWRINERSSPTAKCNVVMTMTGLTKSILVQLLIYVVTAIAICYHTITSAIAKKVLRTSLIQIFIKNLLVCSNYFLSLALSITGTRIHSNSSHYIYTLSCEIHMNFFCFVCFCFGFLYTCDHKNDIQQFGYIYVEKFATAGSSYILSLSLSVSSTV